MFLGLIRSKLVFTKSLLSTLHRHIFVLSRKQPQNHLSVVSLGEVEGLEHRWGFTLQFRLHYENTNFAHRTFFSISLYNKA